MSLPAAVALVAAVPVAVWGLVGQRDAGGVPPSELDHAFRPFAVPEGLDTALGVAALLLTAGAGAVLVREGRRGRFDGRWWSVLLPLVAAGLVAGAGWRVMTAGVVGANIGAGLFVVLGGPLVAALLLWSLARGLWLTLAGPSARGPRRRVTTRSTWGSGA